MTLDIGLRLRVHAARRGRRGARAAGPDRPHAGHPFAADPLRRDRLHARDACSGCSPTSSEPARPDRFAVPSRIVHLPLSLERSRRRAGDAQVPGARAPQRALVPRQHRVHPPHQRACRRGRGATGSSSTPAISCSASATSTSARPSRRRSIRAIAWSRPNTIPPAPGRPRTRSASAAPTCASTAWKGRAAISSSGARSRCGTAGAPRRSSPDALAAPLLRPDPLLSRQPRGTDRGPRRLSARRLSDPHR